MCSISAWPLINSSTLTLFPQYKHLPFESSHNLKRTKSLPFTTLYFALYSVNSPISYSIVPSLIRPIQLTNTFSAFGTVPQLSCKFHTNFIRFFHICQLADSRYLQPGLVFVSTTGFRRLFGGIGSSFSTVFALRFVSAMVITNRITRFAVFQTCH